VGAAAALPLYTAPALAAGHDAHVPTAEDVERVAALVTDHGRRVGGGGSVGIEEPGTPYGPELRQCCGGGPSSSMACWLAA
jgi:hypothetical protein